jgi:hypothetical protein
MGVVENDSIVCLDAISGSPAEANWKINALCSDVNVLALDFSFCSFSRVKREANSIAHELAKFAIPLHSPFSCNAESLPPLVLEAWQRDCLSFASLV